MLLWKVLFWFVFQIITLIIPRLSYVTSAKKNDCLSVSRLSVLMSMFCLWFHYFIAVESVVKPVGSNTS